jgi:hypothetical protein
VSAPAYIEFARTLEGAETGQGLYAMLLHRFPAIGRGDVFLGLTLALSALKADLLVAELENDALRRQLAMRVAA